MRDHKHRTAELTLDGDNNLMIDGEPIMAIDNDYGCPRITAENFLYVDTEAAKYCLQMSFDYWKAFFARSEKLFDPEEIISGKKAMLRVILK